MIDGREQPVRRALTKLWAPIPWMLEVAIAFSLFLGYYAQAGAVAVLLVFSGQAVFYVSREREHLRSSRPGTRLLLSSVIDLTLIGVLAADGILMKALPVEAIFGLLVAAIAFAFLLDAVKLLAFRRFAVI